MTLVKWRRARTAGMSVDLEKADALARISYLQLVLVLAMIFFATAIARGFWA